MDEQVKECGISLNVTETATLDVFSEDKDCCDHQNVMDSQTEDFYRDPSCKPSTQEEKPEASTFEEKSYEQQVAMGEKQVTLMGEDMPDGWHLMEKIKQFFSGDKNSEVMDEFRLIPINIMELVTKSTLYWNNGLKSMAPLDCARNAQFKMITVNASSDGLIVKFQSLIQMPVPNAFLSVNYHPQNTPPKFLLLPDGSPDKYTINEFHLGPAGAADYNYIRFQNPHNKQWYYWMVEGDDIVVRTKTEVNMRNTQIFQTLPAECM